MDNIVIKSYIAKHKNIVVKNIDNMDTSKFIEITNFQEINPKMIDEDYLYGVMLISVNGMTLMDMTYWDDVQALWHYFINAMEEVEIGQQANFYFPNQPIPVDLKQNKNRIVLSIDGKSVNIDYNTWLKSMKEAAIAFFTTLSQLFPRLSREYEMVIDRINKLGT